MTNRLTQKLREIKRKKAKLFCAYVTLGYPNISVTERIIPELEKAGVDIIELGFPFSDPLADGPTIQHASSEAIKKGVTLRHAFQMIRKLRKKGLQIPVIFFTYLNPIMNYGISQTLRQLHQNGFDGLIVPDLPPEEGRMWETWFKRFNISVIYLASPTTKNSRLKEIAKHTNGFIYYVSLRGVTGARNSVPSDLAINLKAIKKITDKPVLVGFGVSSEKQAKEICCNSDGIIVGSAIVEQLSKGRRGEIAAVSLVTRLIRSMK